MYLDGNASWKLIVDEYARALDASRFPGVPLVGIVGRNRSETLENMKQRGWPVVTQADAGWEQVTLTALQVELAGMPDDAAVLYTHSKGALRSTPAENQWRRSMLWHLVMGWEQCVELLGAHDAVGCHWQGTFFAGNFWWARAGYLRGLPNLAPATEEAHAAAAELWLGKGQPRVANLVEGFPPAGTEEGAQRLGPALQQLYTPAADEADIAGEPGFRASGVSGLGEQSQPGSLRAPRDDEYRFPGISYI